ncbi:MAG: YdeI/OmpD-associated family protein [Kribbellaceae bacterium]
MDVDIEVDRQPDVALDPDEHRALESAGLLEQFQSLASEYRYEHLEWIAKAVQPEARRYRITEMCEMLSPEDRIQRPSSAA